MTPMADCRYRLRMGQKIVGYMRKIHNKSTFYSTDSFWWTGRRINYSEIDEWVGLYDMNRKAIFEWDILNFKIDPDADYNVGVVLWQTDMERFVIRQIDSELYFPFEIDGLQLFDQRQLKVISYLFLNRDLMEELGLEEE